MIPRADTPRSVSGGPPVHWPSLSAEEAGYEWDDLAHWVEQYRQRYPTAVRFPDCWYRHNHFVELLAALRDHERASYGRAAPGTAAMEWQLARQHAEIQLDTFSKRLTCGTAGRAHPPVAESEGASDWEAHVQQDVRARRA